MRRAAIYLVILVTMKENGSGLAQTKPAPPPPHVEQKLRDAKTAQQNGEHDKALKVLQEVHQHAREHGLKTIEGEALIRQGQVLQESAKRNPAKTPALEKQAEGAYRGIDDLGRALGVRGEEDQHVGVLAEALAMLLENATHEVGGLRWKLVFGGRPIEVENHEAQAGLVSHVAVLLGEPVDAEGGIANQVAERRLGEVAHLLWLRPHQFLAVHEDAVQVWSGVETV